jgi:glycosyltransferase involved in cell wall biosynthesis
MRIVHLVYGERLAGGETVALQLARAAAGRGDSVEFVSVREGGFREVAHDEGFKTHLVDVSRTFRLGGLYTLTRLLRRRADLLHTHTQLAPNILGRIAARAAGIPVVSHLHIENYVRANRLARLAHRTLDNATARLCSRIVVVSEETKRAFERQGYPGRSMEVVYNGVELPPPPRDGDLRRELRIPTDVPVVAEVARLAEVKGQRVLIDALARLDGACAVLIGDDLEQRGAFRAELARHAERRGVADRVVFAGYRPNAAALAGEADVFVLPSSAEGLPVVLLEAMAHGRPVVATRVGGTPELVTDGETGLLVSPGDVEALASALEGLLRDPERRRRLGDAGRRRVEKHFSAEAMTRRLLEIYQEVARSPS